MPSAPPVCAPQVMVRSTNTVWDEYYGYGKMSFAEFNMLSQIMGSNVSVAVLKNELVTDPGKEVVSRRLVHNNVSVVVSLCLRFLWDEEETRLASHPAAQITLVSMRAAGFPL